MEVRCECGKQLRIPDSLAEKMAKCPGCGKVFKVPAASAAAPGAEKVIVACACGQKLAAPASAVGKQVKCPRCGAAVPVTALSRTSAPAPAYKTTGEDSFELDLSSTSPEPPERDDPSTFAVAGANCANCGSPLEPGAQFCVTCGTFVTTGTRADGVDVATIEREKRAGRKSSLIVAGIIAGVLALAGGTLWYVGLDKIPFLNKASSTPDSGPSSEPAVTPTKKPAAKEAVKFGPGRLKKKKDEGYLENVAFAPDRFRAKTGKLAMEQLVKAFEAEHGRLPKDLDELQTYEKLPPLRDGLEYDYDSKTGKVEVVRTRDRQQAATTAE